MFPVPCCQSRQGRHLRELDGCFRLSHGGPQNREESEAHYTISYKELRELFYMGASVLHEDAIYPARIANIPINIRNTNRPDDPGTMIMAEASEEGKKRVITGIAGSKDFTVIALYKNQLSTERGFVRKLTASWKTGISVSIFPTVSIPFPWLCPIRISMGESMRWSTSSRGSFNRTP